MQLSLRGSLAREYVALTTDASPDRLQDFIDELLESADAGLEKRLEGSLLIIGRVSERGFFPPDW